MAELRVGAYEIVGRLGGGAMGTVHLARSPGGRLVAVKVVRAELAEDPGFRERFRREIAMARAVGGFWTAAVVDADPDAPQPWLATEYVPGLDLHEAVRSTGALPPEAVRGLAAGLAEALAAIHAAGLVHRDLKPSNVLLAADGPRVIDFGISKALAGSELTRTGMVVGTPGYLSPEQIEGREVGPASDVFAFGAVLAFAASGRNPFGEGDTAALMYRAVHTRPDLRDVPPDLRELVARCLERAPRSRPTAAELVAALGGTAAGDWLPTAVRTLVEERRTQVVAARPATRVLPPDHLSPRARWWLERGEHPVPPGGVPPSAEGPGLLRRLLAKAGEAPVPPPAAVVAPAPVAPAPVAGVGVQEQERPAPAKGLLRRWAKAPAEPKFAERVGKLVEQAREAIDGRPGQAVFTTTRRPPATAAVVGFAAAGLLAAAAAEAGRTEHPALGLLVFAVAALVGLVAARRAGQALGPQRRVEVTAGGLSWRRGATVTALKWPKIARVRIVADKNQPWLVVWPRDPAALPGKPDHHGGYRVYPIAHEKRTARRKREIAELRAALTWYGRSAFDET
ncbi:serine/threonine-protein kinase [Actinokineospora sp. NPDC004072]